MAVEAEAAETESRLHRLASRGWAPKALTFVSLLGLLAIWWIAAIMADSRVLPAPPRAAALGLFVWAQIM